LTQATKDWNRLAMGTPEFEELEQRLGRLLTEVADDA
jgi:hypothetical protein